jgi:UPF0042 nucleotide-binding protein
VKHIIISGRSGSGKSVCLHALEDMGFYCIDNLPLGLLPSLIEHVNTHQRIAISIDARNIPTELQQLTHMLGELKNASQKYEIIYLDGNEQTLIKRFSETRRKHPLSSRQLSLKEALQVEAKLLEPVNELADLRIDTSYLSTAQLRALIHDRIQGKDRHHFSLLFQSFGYKFGIPLDADYVFDVRCLPNPYWELHLRNFTGLSPEIDDFLQKQPQTQLLFNNIQTYLQSWLPEFQKDNRNYMTVAIGCTGGKHRSVYIAKKLAEFFSQEYGNVQVRHREL